VRVFDRQEKEMLSQTNFKQAYPTKRLFFELLGERQKLCRGLPPKKRAEQQWHDLKVRVFDRQEQVCLLVCYANLINA
jgi:hypothetical protein